MSILSASNSAVIFTRVSTDKQGALSFEGQEAVCRDWCEREGMEILEVIQSTCSGCYDEQINGDLGRAIRLARENKAILVVAKLCRLSRSVETVARYLREGVPFVSCDLGRDVDPLVLQLFSCMNESFRRQISINTKRALAAKKARGERLGAPLESLKTARIKAEEARRQNAKERNQQKLSLLRWVSTLLSDQPINPSFSVLAEILNTPDERSDLYPLQMKAQEFRRTESNSPKSGIWYANSVSQVVKHAIENNYGWTDLVQIGCWPRGFHGKLETPEYAEQRREFEMAMEAAGNTQLALRFG